MKFIKFKRFVVCFSFFSMTSAAHATVIQYHYGNTYANPTNIRDIKDFRLQIGFTDLAVWARYNGEVFGTYGAATSKTNALLPFALIAKRLGPKLAFGVNISQPIFGNLDFPANSVVAPAATATIINAVDINPVLSYKIDNKLTIGGGLVSQNFYHSEIDYVSSTVGNVVNKYYASALGWNFGFTYTFNPKTYFGLAYFSSVKPNLGGKSVAGNQVNDSYVTGYQTPTNIRLDATRLFTEAWLGTLSINYALWHEVSNVYLVNALPSTVSLPVHYHNAVDVALVTRYQINPKWAPIGLFIYGQGAAKGQGITINFPANDAYGIKFGTDYQIAKNLKLRVLYAHFWLNTGIDHQLGLNIVGRERLRVNEIDANITYDI